MTTTNHVDDLPLVSVDVEQPRTLPPELRIVATYPATDGRAPEQIELTWSDELPPPAAVVPVIDALARAVADRR